MGKKSKRNRSSSSTKTTAAAAQPPARPAPALRRPAPPPPQEEERETKDNLHFEDPYVEPLEDDNVDEDEEDWEDDDDDDEDDEKIRSEQQAAVQSWNPLTGKALPAGEELEMDPSAYKMHHALTAEWPSLSFDFVRDDLGQHRTRFPHCLTVVLGSQADQPHRNELTVMKLSDLARLPQDNDEDEDEDDVLDEVNSDSDKESESDEEVDLDPIVEHYGVKHYGGVNRVRCQPQQPHIVATWSDVGAVNLFNVEPILQRFAASRGKGAAHSKMPTKPFFTHAQHECEGYALDWSTVQPGRLASGDCQGHIHLWTPKDEGGDYVVTPTYPPNEKTRHKPAAVDGAPTSSVEDLQWSPTEATVVASAECGGYVRIFDTRAPNRSMLNNQVHANGSDVNVLSWNALVTNLLATGSDDGVLSVWDLKKFSSSQGTAAVEPLARFTPHQSAITSVEWHSTDESMLAVTDNAGAYVYDLSVEEDTAALVANNNDAAAIPPQLLFCHSGSEQFKEVHWHPQISSCLMTTALSGYSVFIPSNL